MGRNRPSNEDAPRVPGEEGGRPWGKIVLGLILLLLLALLIPFACQALSGGSSGEEGAGSQGSSGMEKNAGDGSSGDGSSGGSGDDSGKQAAADREETSDSSTDSESGGRGGDQSEVRAEVSPPSDQSEDGGAIIIPRARISGADGWIAVHAEDPADGDYTFPDGDPPVEQSSGMVVEPFKYAAASGSASASDSAPNGESASDGVENEPLPDSGGFGALALAGVILLATGSLMRRNLRG